MSHVRVKVTIQSPVDPEQEISGEFMIRDDLNYLPPGLKRDAAWSITMTRVGECFVRLYHAACPRKE